MRQWQINIDTGGTFTDCLGVDPQGKRHRLKVLSSGLIKAQVEQAEGNKLQLRLSYALRDNLLAGYSLRFRDAESKIENHHEAWFQLSKPLELPKEAVVQISAGEEAPLLAARLVTQTGLEENFPPILMKLGTTRGTNALLEGKGDPPLLITSRGFADLPDIGDQQRNDLFTLNIEKPQTFHAGAFELSAASDQEGAVFEEPSASEKEDLIHFLREREMNNAVVAFINSHRNPEQEEALAKLCADEGFEYITTSAGLNREINFLHRLQTALANAYLLPVLSAYLKQIKSRVPELKIMTSAGSLAGSEAFEPKDSLLSGPAGGVVAAERIGAQTGHKQILTFDMGGTSSDVARYSGRFDYQYAVQIGDARVNSPALNIHTVAAGGGSQCKFDGEKFAVGPESGGADPGPACYGAGGPLCLTDVNLLLGRMATDEIDLPLDRQAAEEALKKVLEAGETKGDREQILQGFLDIANEKMAEAIRQISNAQGYDPQEHSLLAFGGAGGMHVCAIAEVLDIPSIILPADAGILSAYGISAAREERFASKEFLLPLRQAPNFEEAFADLAKEAAEALKKSVIPTEKQEVKHRFCYLRLSGQEHSLEIEFDEETAVEEAFAKAYRKLYGHYLSDREIELVSLKLIMAEKGGEEDPSAEAPKNYEPSPERQQEVWSEGQWIEAPFYLARKLQAGAEITGPAVISYPTSTAYIAAGWAGSFNRESHLILQKTASSGQNQEKPAEIELELFSNRFTAIAREMGAMLQRTAISVNIKERMDFSCALLDRHGDLIVNAPHIPVHLGALGFCVKAVKEELSLQEGDVAIVNSPAFGGSHLPDVTLVAPLFFKGELVAYAANRAHHAEIGGISPGSMPARASSLAEEGVVIKPQKIIAAGEGRWEAMKQLFTGGSHPTRAWEENQADLNAALAALESGRQSLSKLLEKFGQTKVEKQMQGIKDYAHQSLWQALQNFEPGKYRAHEKLDDGSDLKVEIELAERLSIDFSGSAGQHPGNLNANPAIVSSVVLYVLRLIAAEDVPLNEGMLQAVDLHIPEGSLLNPHFPDDHREAPAVVGGNVELSQRLTDTLLKAFELAACSQGTMNNVLFGNENFGFYETICGGVGAGKGFRGADAVHQHMTNTKITDPEIMEKRYPVRVRRFALRRNSGGSGRWPGGCGVIRELEFKEPVSLTVLSSHRAVAPYGMAGGESGAPGQQKIIRRDGTEEELDYLASAELAAGDRFVIETPGGGGYGSGPAES